jgi:hypothetical protein
VIEGEWIARCERQRGVDVRIGLLQPILLNVDGSSPDAGEEIAL